MIGEGILLFDNRDPGIKLQRIDSKPYDNGFVQTKNGVAGGVQAA